MSKLPAEWEKKKLGEVCDVIGGGTPSKAIKKYYNGEIHWATVRDMKTEIIADTEHKITIDAVKNSSTNIIPKGNVVIATRVGLGKICLIDNDTAINQDLRGVIPKNQKVLLTVKEQELIVSKLDFLSAGLIHLYENSQKKISALDELKKSILKKALEGEL